MKTALEALHAASAPSAAGEVPARPDWTIVQNWAAYTDAKRAATLQHGDGGAL